MRFLKIMFITIFSLILISGLFAGGANEQKKETKEITIYWNPDHLYKTYDQVINTFVKEKGLKVNIQVFNWSDFKTKINADFAAGTVPDLIEVPSPWIAEFASMGLLEDLTEEIRQWPDSKDWFSSTWTEVSYKDQIFGMKLHHTAFGLFYNKDHFKKAGISKPPATLEELELVINTIDAQLGQDIKPFGFDPTGQYLIPFLVNSETPLLIENNKIAIDTKTARNTLKKLQSIALSGKVIIPDPGGEEARSNIRQLFLSGQMSMMISGPWEIGNIRKNFPDLQYGVAMIPHLAGVDGKTLTAGTGLAIPKGSSLSKASIFELMQQLTSVDTEVAATLEAGMLMPRKSWANDPRIQSDMTVKLFASILPKASPFDIGVRKRSLPEITWGGAVFGKMYQAMIYTDRNMDEILSEYIKEANRLLGE